MAQANTILTRYVDEVARNATVTIQTGTDPGDANYGPEQLITDNPAQVAKINSTTGAWLFDFGLAQRVDLVALIHHDFDAATGSPAVPSVVLEANTSNSWASPAFAVEITIPPWWSTGSRAWPVNPWVDLTTAAPLVGTYNTTGWRYWRLSITGNSQNLQLGAVKMYDAFLRLTSDFREGLGRSQRAPIIENRTAFEVATIYQRGTVVWSQEGTLRLTTDQADEIETHWYDAWGRGYPFVIVPNGLRNVCYFVRRQTIDYRESVLWYDETSDQELIDLPLAVEEVGRGLRPGI